MITLDDLDWWLRTWRDLRWNYAKTMPEFPHSYIVRGQHLSDSDFERAVRVIRTFGEPGKFFDTMRIYLVKDGQRWWTMGAPLEITTIINMAPADQVYGEQNAPRTAGSGPRQFTIYDALATEYDDRYDRPECHRENTQVWKLITDEIPDLAAPSVLDVGCGTGLALDIGLTTAGQFTGVDPSQAMLNALLLKHPDAMDLHPATFEEFLLTSQASRRWDVVISLFGSPSYITPEAIEQMPALAERALVLMHYEPGYAPDYEDLRRDVPHHDTSRRAAALLLREHPGYQTMLGRFQVVVVRPR